MEHSHSYFSACNTLISALGELDMWVESMETVMAKLDEVEREDERESLIKYIRNEIERLDNRFGMVKKDFLSRLNGKSDV